MSRTPDLDRARTGFAGSIPVARSRRLRPDPSGPSSHLPRTTDNKARVAASVSAYFDFVDDGEGAFRLVFESDLRNDPAVRERVERMTQECVDAIAETIAHDTGYRAEEAQLLSIGLSGLMEVGARWWLTSPDRIPKERAVELLMGLAWRGISGTPRTD